MPKPTKQEHKIFIAQLNSIIRGAKTDLAHAKRDKQEVMTGVFSFMVRHLETWKEVIQDDYKKSL